MLILTILEKSKFEVKPEKTVLKSLRVSKNEEEHFNLFLSTPEFRDYVSKQLSNILEKKLETLKKSSNTHKKIVSQRIGGIKLFSDSKSYVELNQEYPVKRQNASYYKRHINSTLTEKNGTHQPSHDVLKQLSVSAEDILNQNETKHWSNRSKAKIFYYKNSPGQGLVSVD